METLIGELESVIKKHCGEYGLKFEISYVEPFPETVNHDASVEKIKKVSAALGYDYIEMEEPLRGSEDYGHYMKLIPGASFFLGAGDVPDIHTVDFDFDDSLIERAVEIFKRLVA